MLCGDFFGEDCLIAQPLRLATAASTIETTVMRVEKAEMLRRLHAEPDFAEVFTVHLLTRNSRVEADHSRGTPPARCDTAGPAGRKARG